MVMQNHTRTMMGRTLARAGFAAGLGVIVSFLADCRTAENAALLACAVLLSAWALVDPN